MAGGFIQLVTNVGAVENIWLNGNPQITFFKTIYRRHTPFASELVPVQFNSNLDFGGSASITMPAIGDLIHRIFFVFDIPKLAAAFINTKSQDIQKIINNTNLTDTELIEILKKYASSENQIEFDRIFNLIDQTYDKYTKNETSRLNILKSIEKYLDPVKININNKSNTYSIDGSSLESELFTALKTKNNNEA